MSTLERFQDWYLVQYDGKWEGDCGITVDTLDGPGWWVSVDPTGTYPKSAGFERFVVECLEDDWAYARVVESIEPACHRYFEAFCGPGGPTEALGISLDQAESPEG